MVSKSSNATSSIAVQSSPTKLVQYHENCFGDTFLFSRCACFLVDLHLASTHTTVRLLQSREIRHELGQTCAQQSFSWNVAVQTLLSLATHQESWAVPAQFFRAPLPAGMYNIRVRIDDVVRSGYLDVFFKRHQTPSTWCVRLRGTNYNKLHMCVQGTMTTVNERRERG